MICKEVEFKSLLMDPQFEFDAPKWVDLAEFASADSLDANSRYKALKFYIQFHRISETS